MFNLNGREWRNLSEQVLKNKTDITKLVQGSVSFAEFGIKVINVSFDGTQPSLPPEPISEEDNMFGYAWLVRNTLGAFDMFIWTRDDLSADTGVWLNIGEFPKSGPKGDKGDKGEKGEKGEIGLQGTRGSIWSFGTIPTSGMLTGDFYLAPNLELFFYANNQYNSIGSIRGATGATGQRGADGLIPFISNGYWWIGTSNTGVRAEGTDGQSLNIMTGIYQIATLPNFNMTGVGDAFIVSDDPTYGQSLYIHGYGGVTWTIIQFGAIPGPQGPQGPKGEDSDVTLEYVDDELTGKANIDLSNVANEDIFVKGIVGGLAAQDSLSDLEDETLTLLNTKVDKVEGKGLSTNDYTNTEKNNLALKIGGNTIYGGTVVDNLNTITKSGFYTCYGTATGVPSSNYSWFVLHENSNAGVVSAKQTATAYSTETIIYVRTKISSTWGAWEQLVGLNLTQTLSNKTLASPNITTTLKFNGNILGSAGGLDYIAAKWLGVDGYIKYGSGLMIQWGSYGRSSIATPTVSFPLTFPNRCWIVVAGRTTGDNNIDTFAVAVKDSMTTKSNFTAYKQAPTDRGFDWIAIGN